MSVCTDCKEASCRSHLTIHTRQGGCSPWRAGQVEGAGRGLFAARNIQAGEVVVQDYPVVEGPLPAAGDVCVVCLADQDSTSCSGCQLPHCRTRTRQCASQHRAECSTLQAGRNQGLDRVALFTCIAVVRLLRAVERDPDTRALLEPLMDHRELHQEEDEEEEEKSSSWAQIRRFLSAQGFSAESVERCLGLLQTNGVTSCSVGGAARGHALYPVFSIVNNSCIANTRHGKQGDAFCLIATVDIKAGEEITTSYKSPTLGNIVRKPAFKSLWNFDCTCARCSDPTELSTYSSSLLCEVCNDGPLIPTSSLDMAAPWRCDRCAGEVPFNRVDQRTTELDRLVRSTGQSVEKLENMAAFLARKVHQHHFLLMQVKRMLLLMYGNCSSHRMDSLTKQQLARKIDLCREYIAVYSLLEPGLTKWKGRVCEELARALVRQEGGAGAEVCRLLGEAGKCRQLDSQEERAAFTTRMVQIMSG